LEASKYVCDICEASEESNLLFCSECDLAFCSLHWDEERKHKPTYRDVTAHQQMSIIIAKLVQLDLSSENQDASTRAQLHHEDLTSLWFGVHAQDTDTPGFINNNVYQELINASNFTTREQQFPALVSFVGDTGAGKSTLIVSRTHLAKP
jgi:hypothetical protein